ncbi:ABC transporter permease [uncultured Roseibium sp.]|uniref:ABC transporter permease n=1 Tax=uncultured Roseibium sp. TaxID=1936171 RepID=UPI0026106AED|nr:ABC transporter permease [uncultured Roseibium sp.]
MLNTRSKVVAFILALGRRLTGLLCVLFGVSLITFTMTYFAPGDKASAIANARYPDVQGFPPEILDGIREEFSLNEPFFVQFFQWLYRFVQGDFGNSFASNTPVWDIFVANAAETFSLTATALVLGLVLAFALSSIAVWRPGSLFDRASVALASVGAAMPNYWLGLLLILLFAAQLNWLPAYGTGSPSHLVLPALTLAFWITASQTRLLRAFFLEAKAAPYIETLRLRGVSETEIFWRHIFRHAAVPALTMIGLDIASLLEGAVIVELTFARGGIGSLLAGSVLSRDYPMVLFLVLFSAVVYVFINSMIEFLQEIMDPRNSVWSHQQAVPSGEARS